MKSRIPFFLTVLLTASLLQGCSRNYQFLNREPVSDADDRKASAVPGKTDFEFVEYAVSSSVRYPLVRAMDPRRSPRSLDVNSMDQVPASSWFTPRLGYSEISADKLINGLQDKGAPQAPLTIVKAKSSGNSPGFVVKDSRGIKYLLKFDRTDYPDIETTGHFVGSRLFWGFGYNVPEDYVYSYSPADATADKGIDQEQIDKVLLLSHMNEDGKYRCVASRFLDGTILGPIPQRGTRSKDSNDLIPHENRRTLRALRMFCAWLGNSGVRSDNTLDVYTGEAGSGHTVHYMLDFGEIFGAHGVEKGRNWDGYEHFFSLADTGKTFATLGIPQKKWENFKLEDGDFVGTFEAETFQPGKWKETTQFLPIRSSLADDDYWAAKIIAAVKPEHLRALLDKAGHPDKDYPGKILEVLEKRREKVIRHAYSRVSSIEMQSLDHGTLELKDIGKEFLGNAEYRVKFLNKTGKSVAGAAQSLSIPVADALKSAKGYLIVEVTAVRGGKRAPRAAQFHIRENEGAPAVVGVVH